MEHQLSRLETAVHNMTMRLMQVSEKVVSIEAELGRRKHLATQKRKERKRRIQGALSMTNDSFRPIRACRTRSGRGSVTSSGCGA